MERVKGKIAVVTGAALGIGRAVAELLAAEGAHVAVTDILDDSGEEVVEEIRRTGRSAHFWHMDVADEEAVKRTFAEVKEHFGLITVVVNNAGIGGPNKQPHEYTEKEWDLVMAVNVKGPFFCTKYAIPQMKEAGGGSIINLSSIYGIVGAADAPAYHASKGAVRLMTKTDALFYAKDNIRVNSLHPGFVWTPLVENAARSSGTDVEEFRAYLTSLHPVGYLGDPMDIAYGVLFLASDESRFMTGSEMVMDGGYTAR